MIGIIKKVNRLFNRQLNKETIANKVFCIGLHKTGTTTLANYFREFGFYTIHSTDWINDKSKLKKFDFFSDGGSHFDNINEFDFAKLFYTYKQSKFILQTRDTEKWAISKLKHAAWNQNTEIQENDFTKIAHNEWRYKSFLTVQKFIEHKYNYEKKVLDFFKKNDFNRLLILNITQSDIQASELNKLNDYLKIKSINKIELPHSNNRRSDISIPKDVHDFIKQKVISYK